MDGDGFQGAAPGSDDVLKDTTYTNGEGNYWFDGLTADPRYYVAIPAAGFPIADVRSSAGVSSSALGIDNDDDGAPSGTYISVSSVLDLKIGSALTAEHDAVEPGDGSGTADVSAEAEANAVTGAYRDLDSYLSVDFGFVNVPLYRIGNLVWLDANNDGVAQDGEKPIGGVLVQLVNSSGTVVAETVTDSEGKYSFENLLAGDYSVRIPKDQTPVLGGSLSVTAGALENLASSTVDATSANNDADNDDNGVDSGATWSSATVTVGSTDDAVTETEPSDETLRADDSTDDDSGWSAGPDERSNVTVDFGFYQLLRLGDIVWLDNGGDGPTRLISHEDDGIWDPVREDLLPGVSVYLYRDNGDGVFDQATDSLEYTTATNGVGRYYFTNLTEGDYFVAIPDSQQAPGKPLAGLRSSTGQASDFTVNDLDQGAPVTSFAAVSKIITLTAGAMANGDSGFEDLANTTTGLTIADASSNLAVDFGFSPVPTYALGNLVWEDFNNNGVANAGESGIGGIDVQLFEDDGDGVFDASADTLVTTTTTDSVTHVGRYLFEDLPAGDYFVHVPTQSALDGWYVGGTAVAANDTDNDNNALSDAVDGWTSPLVTLGGPGGPSDHAEPTGETDGIDSFDAESLVTTRDDRSNQTIDFGFWRGLRLGNQVWRDESAAAPGVHSATDNNGVFDLGEVGIAGVTVELWRDANGNGFQGPASDDVLVDSVVTDSEGNYVFEHLTTGTAYFVAIPTVGSPLVDAKSSAGQASAYNDADNDDDGAPVGAYLSVSQRITLTVGGLTTGEADTVEPGDASGGAADANAEDEANAATAFYPDANSALDADFGFVNVPLYRIGNLVWIDRNNNGVAEPGEPGVAGVQVTLLDDGGHAIASTVTDADGHYLFPNLTAGDYQVRVAGGQAALANLASSTTDAASANNDTDNDDNGIADGADWTSAVVTLGSADDAVTETEPTNETLRSGDTTDDDGAWTGGTDARSNVSVDFGFYELLRLGDLVWLDNGGNGGGYVPANEDNGALDSGETAIDGVTVTLFKDGGDGAFGGDDTVVGTTTTTGGGWYYFTGLTEGTYFAAIPATDHGAGKPLENLRSSTGQAANFSTNDRDQGAPSGTWAAVTKAIVLTAGAMNNGDSAFEAQANTKTLVTVPDASSNLAVDFGFSPVPAYALGNLVWEDYNDNGVADSGESGIGGITVELYKDVNGNGSIDSGEPLVDSTVTDTGANAGRYHFDGLAAGDYLVHIPSQSGLSAWQVGGTPSAADDVDNDNNALTDATDGWTSPTVTLGGAAGPADHNEPTGETDGIDGADAEAAVAIRDDRSNQTIDFGFWRGLRLGNQVWLDEGAGDHQDNGRFDADETPVVGATVELFADNGDHVFDSSTDSLIDTTVTDADGRYFFEHLNEGDYFVAIASVSPAAKSSTGTVGGGLADDGLDDGDPIGTYVSVSGELTLALGAAPTGETDGPGTSGGDAEANANAVAGYYPDASSFLTADFGLIDVPLYRIGNLVWIDGDNDGKAEPGEPGVDGVLVQLTSSTGVVIAETVTSGGGLYEFGNLAEGDYRVQIPSSQVPSITPSLSASIVADALTGFYPSTSPSSTDDSVDNDANGVEFAGGARSALIHLGGAEAVTEETRLGSGVDDDLGQASPRIDDDRSDFTVDFGYYSISVGNQVFRDANGDGVYVPADGDAGIDGVTVELRDSTNAVIATQTTSGGGLYLFTGLRDGESYSISIPASQFAVGAVLEGLFSSPSDAGSVSVDDSDGKDRGIDPATTFGAVRSDAFVASASASPVTDGEGDNPDNDTVRPDAAENLVLDFGFYAMELGGTLFKDPNNDGVDASDGDFAGVTVTLLTSSGSPYIKADGSAYTTVTNGDGDYRFVGLPQGDYIVEIPASQFAASAVLDGWANSDGNDPVPSPNTDVTGDDNGYPVSGNIFSGGAVRSQVVTLAVASEPLDDPKPSSGYIDSQSNLSVDFGFWHAQAGLELGNQLWFDTVKDGVFGPGELAVPAGVELQLLDADTGAVLDTTFTDANGRYLFKGLSAGRYVVLVTAENFKPGKPLAGWTSTDGAGAKTDPNGGEDLDSNALPLAVTGVKSGVVVLLAATPIGEVDAASAGLDDRQSNLTVDFGFVRVPVLAFTGADVGGALRTAGLLAALGAIALLGAARRRDQEN